MKSWAKDAFCLKNDQGQSQSEDPKAPNVIRTFISCDVFFLWTIPGFPLAAMSIRISAVILHIAAGVAVTIDSCIPKGLFRICARARLGSWKISGICHGHFHIFSCQILNQSGIIERCSKNNQRSNFMKIRPVGGDLCYAYGQTDTTKLIVAFRNFTNLLKMDLQEIGLVEDRIDLAHGS
jgi:hypothetical protein